ncbi:armadillo repeat-containing protein 6 homolog [Aethina tumida]|uniref:armadillo repeat-containing protein 6 homolog n=1 Tax=Aethina tumida TaxID=116153 RepID=UPI00096AF328|nr:armadillo repeat-containing protein 6 homolog [Aethina tumida]
MGVKITQETFNKAVKENIEELGMDEKEAIEDAYKQFELQGADLSLISKDTLEDTEAKQKEIQRLVQGIQKATKQNSDSLVTYCKELKALCDADISNRVVAGNCGAYTALVDALDQKKECSDYNHKVEILRALSALMTKNPDLLDPKGLSLILFLINVQEESSVKRALLRWVKECCVMHELNRQNFMDNNIIQLLKPNLEKEDSEVQREVMSVMRALVLDDDVRVEFGRAHDNARIIASETLCMLTVMMTKYHTDEKLIYDLLMTITALMVRAEFCKKVESAGGLTLIKDVMGQFPSNEKIVKQCFRLVKALAGNDDVKACLIQSVELSPLIQNTLNIHKNSPTIAVSGLAAIAALSLRNPENSRKLFEAGIPELIVDIMKLFPDDKSIQKTGSWAIRNMVSRSRNQSGTFLAAGVEQILQRNLTKFKEFEYDTKAALRDLGCAVTLSEEWTGKGGALTTGKCLPHN